MDMNSRLKNVLRIVAGSMLAWSATKFVLRQQRTIDLQRKVVLITGGSRGLGLVLAREFAARGARIAICARNANQLSQAAADLRSRGAEVLYHACDVTHRDQVQELAADVRETLGPIDVLVNNAGIIQSGPLDCMTIDDFQETMTTHFWGPLYMMEAILPEMRRRREGRIVNIASFGGLIAVPHLVPYCASKFALVGLSRGLRASLSGEGVFVTTVCPGLMRTGSARNANFKGQHRREYAYFSISSSLPVVSIDAGRAARQIVDACRHGDPELHPTFTAKLIGRIANFCPNAVAEATSLANSLLPAAGGIGTDSARGHESASKWSPSWITTLNDRAAIDNNEHDSPPSFVGGA